MIFDSHIQGIPCQIEVTSYAPTVNSNRSADPLDDPYDPGEFEFEVLDRRGRKAGWLADKLTESDRSRIEDEHAMHLRQDRAEYEIEKAQAMGEVR